MKIGESHSYKIIYFESLRNEQRLIEVTATMGVFPTIYRIVLNGSDFEIKDAALFKQTPEDQIVKLAISAFKELKEKYASAGLENVNNF